MQRNPLLLITFIFFSNLTNATIWVGGDANCDYSSIQPALDELVQGSEEQLYIANNNAGNGVYTENLILVNNRTDSDLIRIQGGYEDCEGNRTDTNTELNGGGLAPVMNILGDDTVNSRLRISNLTFTNGFSDNSYAGGLNIIDNNSRIDLIEVKIINNQGSRGGGLFSQGSADLVLRLIDTLVSENTAEFGGGVFCAGNKVSINDQSGIVDNTAESNDPLAGHGGGMYLAVGCNFLMAGGGLDLLNQAGVISNSAVGHGGGTYVDSGSLLRLTQVVEGQGHIVYSDNIADFDNNGDGNGGAIYLSDQSSTLSVTRGGVIIKNNRAVNGGAVAVTDGAFASISSSSRCSLNNPCSLFTGNKAGNETNALNQGYGGTFYVNDATLTVSKAAITGSNADIGVIGFVDSGGSINIDFSMIYGNGLPLDMSFSRNSLFTAVSSTLKLSHVTLTDNSLFESSALVLKSADSDLLVNNSIIQNQPQQTMAIINNEVDNAQNIFVCNVLHEDMSIGVSNDIVDNTLSDNPGFIDRATGDYRLSDGSVAIDKCDEFLTTGFTQLDFEGQITGIDDPSKADATGTYDAGADESYQWDVIFTDDFQ